MKALRHACGISSQEENRHKAHLGHIIKTMEQNYEHPNYNASEIDIPRKRPCYDAPYETDDVLPVRFYPFDHKALASSLSHQEASKSFRKVHPYRDLRRLRDNARAPIASIKNKFTTNVFFRMAI